MTKCVTQRIKIQTDPISTVGYTEIHKQSFVEQRLFRQLGMLDITY